jgi:hypothetical protein
MGGILEDLFNVRTNGNGFINSEWDDVLLKRDLERLITAGHVKEVPHVIKKESSSLFDSKRKWYRDCETGDTYEYTPGWERGGPHFTKVSFDDLFMEAPNPRPI